MTKVNKKRVSEARRLLRRACTVLNGVRFDGVNESLALPDMERERDIAVGFALRALNATRDF